MAGDAIYVSLTTTFGWWDRVKVLLGCEVRQRVTVQTELADVGPTTTTTSVEVAPLFSPRAPPPQGRALDLGDARG